MRILIGQTTGIPSPPFVGLDEGIAVPDDDPTVQVSGLVAGGLADPEVLAVEDQPGKYRAVLSGLTHASSLDTLTVTWNVTLDGRPSAYRQTVEVVTDHYATLPELRAHPDLAEVNNVTGALRVSDDQLRAWRDGFADLVERARGASWVGRLGLATAPPHPLRLKRHVRQIEVLASGEGDPLSLDGWTIDATRRLVVPSTATLAVGAPLACAYTYGLEGGPLECLRAACREYVREATMAPASGVARNAITWGDGNGGTYRIGTADWNRDRFTGLNDVDRFIREAPDYRVPGIG